jgi:FkbM family methyltransferase
LKEGATALDIGANIGYYALIESKLVGDAGKVYALEPVKNTYDRLTENILLNKCKNIETFNFGASSENTSKIIHISRFSNWSSFVNTVPSRFSHTEEVKVVCLDDFLINKNKPDFIRMDVEGYEYAILKGLSKTLYEKKEVSLLIEIHPDLMTTEQLDQVFSILQTSGLTKVMLLHEPYRSWINRRSEIRPTIRWITKLIGDTEKLGEVEEITIEEAKSLCVNKKKLLYALFIKETNQQHDR